MVKLVVISFILLSSISDTMGFAVSSSQRIAEQRFGVARQSEEPIQPPSLRSKPALSMSSALMERSKAPTFEERMRNVVLGNRKKKKDIANKLPENVEIIRTVDDYKRIVVDEKDRIVVVRFFAPWCKACKAITPFFYRVARQCTDVLFVEVPVTEKTTALHQGLGISKLPFTHIYTPDGGLVEELRITRPYFADFAHKLQSYMVGSCELKDGDTSSPYSPLPADLNQPAS